MGASASSADGSSAESGASALRDGCPALDGMAAAPDVVGATTLGTPAGRPSAESASTAPRATRSVVAAHGGHAAQLLGHRPRHERDPRRAADQQQGRQLPGLHAGRRDRAAQGVHRPVDVRRDQPLERRPIKPDGAAELAAPDPHHDLVLGAQRLFREGARAPDPRDRRHVVGQRLPDVLPHQLVEVETAEVVDRLGDAQHREAAAGRPGPAQHGGVEPAAAEVVDRDRVARLPAPAATAWATARGSATNVTPRSCAARAEASLSSVCGAHDAGCARAIRAGCSPSFSTTRSTTQRTSRADSSSADHGWPPSIDRRRVSHPTLEAANDARRVDPGETRRGLADGHALVPGEVQHRRHGAPRAPSGTTSVSPGPSARRTTAAVKVFPKSMPSW